MRTLVAIALLLAAKNEGAINRAPTVTVVILRPDVGDDRSR